MPARALQTRLRDRFYDLYVHLPMQKIVGDRLAAAKGTKDPHGVEEARAQLRTSYAMIEQQMAAAAGRWARISALPIAPRRRRCSTATWSSRSAMLTRTSRAYLERLKARPSFARVLKEAEPYFQMVPQES